MNVLTHLQESMRQFSATEQRIAAYILENADVMTETSITAVAQACGTSKSMIVQMCKKAGYKGYKDFCKQLSVEMAIGQREKAQAYEDMHPGYSVAQICQLTMQKEMLSLQNTLNLLDTEMVGRATEAILRARRIHLFGVGNSAVVALDMHNKLQRIGFDSHFSHDIHCQLTAAATLVADDCIIIFSYNGETRDMVNAAHFAREAGAAVITVTRYGQSTVSELADIPLFVAANESLVRSAAMSSRLAMLSMVDMLFSCVASERHDDIKALLQRSARVIKASEQR